MVRVVIPCCEHDQDQAERLIRWIAELGKVDAKGHLHCSRSCKVDYLMALMKDAFTEVKFIEDLEDIKSNWREPGHHHKSAAGPNSLFRQVAWYFNLRDPNPWLFLEPDAYPCRADWYAILCSEWERAKLDRKMFVGAKVLSTVPGSDIPTHMSGVAIYHPDTPGIANASVIHNETAFDITGAPDFMPRARFTNVIVHHFRAPEFESMKDLDSRVPVTCAVYHASKSGSILPYLRQRLGLSTPVWPASPITTKVTVPVPMSIPDGWPKGTPFISQTTCDIYIKTFRRDFPWLEWCLKSIEKYAKGFRKVIVQSPIKPDIEGDYEWVQSEDQEPTYLDQQSKKLNADFITDSDFILYMDSDCVFTREVTPEEFLVDGKPTWLVTPFSEARDDQSVWIPCMEEFTGKKPTHECMRRHPFFVPRWALAEVRKFCEYKHSKTLNDYIISRSVPGNPLALTFSEWNCLGWFLYSFHNDKIHWIDESKDHVPEACCWQGFTHAGDKRMQEDLAHMASIVDSAPEPLPEPQKPVQTISERIRGHVEALREIVMENKTSRVQMLHQELRAAGLLGPAQKRKVERNEMAVV